MGAMETSSIYLFNIFKYHFAHSSGAVRPVRDIPLKCLFFFFLEVFIMGDWVKCDGNGYILVIRGIFQTSCNFCELIQDLNNKALLWVSALAMGIGEIQFKTGDL